MPVRTQRVAPEPAPVSGRLVIRKPPGPHPGVEGDGVRIASRLGSVALVLLGLSVLASLLVDGTAVTRLLGLDPQGRGAVVVLAGLAVVALALGLGLRPLSGPRRSDRNAQAR